MLKGSFSLSVTVDFDLCNDTPGGLDSSVNVFVDYFNVMRKVKWMASYTKGLTETPEMVRWLMKFKLSKCKVIKIERK